MFLICGEALFDLFLRPSVAGELCLDAVPGGSPFNVALGLARLGQKAEFFSGLCSDLMGKHLAVFMEKESIGSAYAVRSPHPTALSIVALTPDGVPDYAFYPEFPAYRAVAEADLPGLGPDIGVIHMGSIATVLQPVGSALAALAERECGRRLVTYDPNIRPTIVPDLDVWRSTFERLTGLAHLTKVSAEDLELLYPGRTHEDLARAALERGTRLLVITRGREGASGWTRATKSESRAFPVEVVDTVGAGDSYQSALLAGLAEMGRANPGALDALSGETLTRLLNFAGQAAAFTCGKRGADLPRRADIAMSLS